MSAPSTIPELLDTLTKSVTSALDVAGKVSSLKPAENAVSLLDLKNELLLSYLQNMVFLIIVKLRQAKGTKGPLGNADSSVQDIGDAVVMKLVELRLYLEKGVKPLEDKMRYQIELLIRASVDAANAQRRAVVAPDDDSSEAEETVDGIHASASDQALSESEAAASDPGSSSESEPGSDAESDVESDPESEPETVYPAKPRLSALTAITSVTDNSSAPDGIYRPPKRERQLMEPTVTQGRSKTERRPHKSATVDEFVADELSAVPMPLPSIGTTIVGRGRHVKTDAERKVEEERRDYEEMNFVRLPKVSKKEKSKKLGREGGGKMVFGGEEWRDLGDRVDRIDRLVTKKDKGRGSNVKALLDKSRKRGAGQLGGGEERAQVGERFEKRLKMMEGGRRDRGKRR